MPTYSASTILQSLTNAQVGQCFGYAAATPQTIVITSVARVTNVVTVTLAAAGPFTVGQTVVIAGVTPVGATTFDGTFTVASVPTSVTFTYAQTADDDTGADGTATGDSIYEPMPVLNTSSTAFAIPDAPYGSNRQGRAITWGYSVVTAPGAITVALQGSMTNAEADFYTIATQTTVGGATTVTTGVSVPFLRLKITALTLTNGAGLRARIMP